MTEQILQRLNARKQRNGKYMCRCPLPHHEDKNPSFQLHTWTYKGKEYVAGRCYGCGEKVSYKELMSLVGIVPKTRGKVKKVRVYEYIKSLERAIRAEEARSGNENPSR